MFVSRETFILPFSSLLYLFIRTKRTLMSLGDTPGIRDACARVTGLIAVSFCRASVERPWMSL